MSKKRSSFLRLKLAAIAAVVFVGIAGFSGMPRELAGVSASAFGPASSHTNAPGENNCTECHNQFPVNSGNGSVTISGRVKTPTLDG